MAEIDIYGDESDVRRTRLRDWLQGVALAARGTSLADSTALPIWDIFLPLSPLFRLYLYIPPYPSLLLPTILHSQSQIYGDLDESKPSVSTSTPNQSTSTAASSSGGQDAKVCKPSHLPIHRDVRLM